MPNQRPLNNRDLCDFLTAWLRDNYPTLLVEVQEVVLRMAGERLPIRLPYVYLPEATPLAPMQDAFVPTPFQQGILEALEGVAMRTGQLGAAVGDRSRLYRPGGLQELRDQGLVEHHPRLGFFRPDAPPPELGESAAKT